MIQRGRTGIAQYVFAFLKALISRPDRPDLTLFVLEEDEPLFEFARNHLRIELVAERHRPPVRNILWHQFKLPSLARSLDLDVLHVPSYRRMVWRHTCALVSTIHDLAPFRVRGKYDPLRMFYGRVVVRALAHRQHEVIAISQHTAADIKHFFDIPDERVTVVHNGLDKTRFSTIASDGIRSKTVQALESGPPFFLYVSRLEHPAKNHVRLIEAFTRFKEKSRSDWILVLGGSDWHGAEHIHEAARVSSFKSDIRFLGFVPDEDLPHLYRAAGAMVYPSLFEGFGLPPIEAMACGCPVLSSHCGALEEIVGRSAALIDPENVAAISGELERVASSPEWRESLRRRGFENIRRFDWDENVEKVLQIYSRAKSRAGRI